MPERLANDLLLIIESQFLNEGQIYMSNDAFLIRFHIAVLQTIQDFQVVTTCPVKIRFSFPEFKVLPTLFIFSYNEKKDENNDYESCC